MNRFSAKEQLLQIYPYRVELHAHTSPVSACSEIPPEAMAEIYKENQYDTVVVTNHFWHSSKDKKTYVNEYMEGYLHTKEVGEQLGISVLLGAEIRFTENCNDYLLYGVNREMLEEIYERLPYGLEQFRNSFSLENSVLIHAHPFREGTVPISAKLLDGVEVFNMHPGHNSRIALASKYAAKFNVPIITAGSDFHHLNRDHEAGAALRSNSLPNDSFELATLLKNGDYLLEISKSNLIIP